MSNKELHALDVGDHEYWLHVGDPYRDPPKLTWREYFETYQSHLGTPEIEAEECEVDLDDPADPEPLTDAWEQFDSPYGEAFHLLKDLDLGPELTSPKAIGELVFYEQDPFGPIYYGVVAPNDLSLSLLQHRLNQLNTGIRIQMAT